MHYSFFYSLHYDSSKVIFTDHVAMLEPDLCWCLQHECLFYLLFKSKFFDYLFLTCIANSGYNITTLRKFQCFPAAGSGGGCGVFWRGTVSSLITPLHFYIHLCLFTIQLLQLSSLKSYDSRDSKDVCQSRIQ